MKAFYRTVHSLSNVTRWVGMATLFFMMVFIFVAVIGRSIHHPLLGDVEIVEFSMLVLIMFSLAYTQLKDGHIKIGIIVDRLPARIQTVIDMVGLAITTIVCSIIGLVFVNSTIEQFTGSYIKSTLLNIPEVPFKIIIAIGFFLWGLEALLKILKTLITIIQGETEGDEI